MSFGGFVEDLTPTTEIERLEVLHAPLAAAVRELIDATIRTTVDDEDVVAAIAEVQATTRRLRSSQLPGAAGVRFNHEGRSWGWGNAVVGLRNPLAPPLDIVHDPSGLASADFFLGAAYEGPPGLVHGGISALLMDQVMGETASQFTRVTMTGTLTLRYLRGTPLGALRIEARIDREEGRKVIVVAHIGDADGPCVEAEGIFVIPRWSLAEGDPRLG